MVQMNNEQLIALLGWDVVSSTSSTNEDRGCQQEELVLRGGQTATIYHNNNVPFRAFEHKAGKKHGIYAELYDGELSQITHYVDDLEHGQSKQYSEGQLIGLYSLNMGTGIDVWFDAPDVLSEEHHMYQGKPHGPERWWNGDNQTIWREVHYVHGKRHGIERQWNEDDDEQPFLEEGYPKFWIDDQEVSKQDYLRHDDVMPYDAKDDNPTRMPPAWQSVATFT